MDINNIVSPELLRQYQSYTQRFPEGTSQQFFNYIRRNQPQLTNYARRLLGTEARTLRGLGPVGDIVYYGTLPMRKDEILKEYNMYIDDNGNITGRI